MHQCRQSAQGGKPCLWQGEGLRFDSVRGLCRSETKIEQILDDQSVEEWGLSVAAGSAPGSFAQPAPRSLNTSGGLSGAQVQSRCVMENVTENVHRAASICSANRVRQRRRDARSW